MLEIATLGLYEMNVEPTERQGCWWWLVRSSHEEDSVGAADGFAKSRDAARIAAVKAARHAIRMDRETGRRIRDYRRFSRQ